MQLHVLASVIFSAHDWNLAISESRFGHELQLKAISAVYIYIYIYTQFTYILWYCDFRLTSQQWLVLQLSLKTCTISSFSWSGHVCGIAWYNFNPPGKIHSITGEINLPICSPINQPTFRAAIGPVLVHHIYRPPHTVDVWTHTGTFFKYKVGVKQPRNIVWSHPTSKA